MDETAPTLTQVQIIQSLAEALSWFEKELSWGVAAGELNHLTGRIGELYAAMITRGQMALETNQRGYDVISAENERISVKTVTSSGNVAFNPSTFELVDRVMILRVNVDDELGISVEEIFDDTAIAAKERMRKSRGKLIYSLAQGGRRERRPVENLKITVRAKYKDVEIVKYESGAIRILREGVVQDVVVKDVLRPIAAEFGIDVFNPRGDLKNTRVLGAEVIRALNAGIGSRPGNPV